MVYKQDATKEQQRCYFDARGRFMQLGGVEGIKERLDGYRAIKAKVAAGGECPAKYSAAKLTAAIAKYEKELADLE